MSTLNT